MRYVFARGKMPGEARKAEAGGLGEPFGIPRIIELLRENGGNGTDPLPSRGEERVPGGGDQRAGGGRGPPWRASTNPASWRRTLFARFVAGEGEVEWVPFPHYYPPAPGLLHSLAREERRLLELGKSGTRRRCEDVLGGKESASTILGLTKFLAEIGVTDIYLSLGLPLFVRYRTGVRPAPRLWPTTWSRPRPWEQGQPPRGHRGGHRLPEGERCLLRQDLHRLHSPQHGSSTRWTPAHRPLFSYKGHGPGHDPGARVQGQDPAFFSSSPRIPNEAAGGGLPGQDLP